jgi:hypothetical protein
MQVFTPAQSILPPVVAIVIVLFGPALVVRVIPDPATILFPR